MDKQNKRYEQRKAGRVIKDNGDTKKLIGKVNCDKSFPPDRGDSNQRTIQKNDKKKEDKHDTVGAPCSRKPEKREAKILDAKDKKVIREKYTLRLRSLNHVNSELSKNEINASKQVDYKNVEKIKKPLNTETETPKVKESYSNNSKNSGKSEKPEYDTRRKPVIKTIMSKNDTMRIFKAVTFVDQKKKPMTPLKINIPNDISKKPKPIETFKPKVKATVSRVSVKEKPVMKKTGKCRRMRRHVTSPDMSVTRRVRSPPTEVAKWAPTSINHHTKPYYEAWVDTTLTAFSKNNKDQQFLDKQAIIRSFKRAFEDRPLSPELMYEKLSDEKFTGRIKVRLR
ncbi:uncharacterized protein LOC115453402 [Manduca sexta]|uniref:uncharacterized protein LOC115453402 n=1 Tax=Manduca sexta TaxID=7130 RepID=UPI001181FD87|nr:uncharacterized protein LOC115453402 [Manduca sexta]KAG6438516.1 hypothetical protein O3G_MSEX000030 [Manduca sexta]